MNYTDPLQKANSDWYLLRFLNILFNILRSICLMSVINLKNVKIIILYRHKRIFITIVFQFPSSNKTECYLFSFLFSDGFS